MLFDVFARVLLTFVLTTGAYFVTRFLLMRFALPLLERSRPTWALPVEHSRLPMLTALLVAVMALGFAVSPLGTIYPRLAKPLEMMNTTVGIGILTFMLATIASVGLAIYETKPLAKDVPLTGFVQLVEAGIFLTGFLMIVTTFMGVPPIHSFTVLAALFTALGFVFQEPIIGFIAGIQLAANKMVAIGDWIDMTQYGASGIVQEILMSSVKVQNWDNTVTTVPARAMISDSFKNWHAMYVSGGRRVQRSVYLDIYSVCPLTSEVAAHYPALARAWQQIGAGNLAVGNSLAGDAATEPTNLGIYRVYLADYLRRHPRVNQQMLIMVHQLQVQQLGLPLELYFFILDTDWPDSETTTSSIFEYVFATLPQFGLRPFQWPLTMAMGDQAQTSAGQIPPTPQSKG